MSVLIALLAANGSTKLLFLYIPFIIWLFWRKTANITIVLAILIAALFFCMLKWQTPLPTNLSDKQEVYWTNQVKIDGNQVLGMMKNSQGVKIYSRYEIKDEQEKQMFMAESLVGKRYMATGNWEEAATGNHEFVFNMQKYLKQNHAVGMYKITNLQVIEEHRSLFTLLHKQRFSINQRIDHYFPPSIRAEAKALIIGDQQEVELEHQQSYQKLGITHLFAISGLHIALLSFIFQQFLLRLHVRREHVLLLLLIALPTYAIIAGGSPSVWRSVITVVVIMIMQWLTIDISLESAISLCFLIFVSVDPLMIYQIGFQLSFLAALAIIISSTYLAQLKSWLTASLWITISCQLIVSPLLLYHFYEISLSSFLMNLVFVPLFSYIVLPINILLLFLSFIPGPFFHFIATLYVPCRQLLTTLIQWLEQIPYQMWNPGRPSLFLLCGLLIVVIAFFYAMERGRFRKTTIVLLLVYCVFLNQAVAYHDDLRISFISVGQGDSTLIELPNQKQVYLIDSGGILRFAQEGWKKKKQDYEVGRQIIVPYLKGRGINRIDKLILTHADADHVEGADEVMKQIAVSEINISPSSSEKSVMDDLLRQSQLKKVPIKEKMAGESWRYGDLTMTYIMPRDLEYEGNNDSIVTVINYQGFRIIVPGDLESTGENEIVANSPETVRDATILKAGHHGSKTSTSQEWLQEVNPQLVIYSTGKNNRYNHPAKEVTERVNNLGIPSFNTAEVGTVQLSINRRAQLQVAQKKYELSR
ncbi:MAG: DNA internalization-related competence protein ComEC/Rec2 [Kurthia sp.]|nr:DNA internalization-related competence protein ComEC/Rec2 [Candidatus Kurthia equi]